MDRTVNKALRIFPAGLETGILLNRFEHEFFSRFDIWRKIHDSINVSCYDLHSLCKSHNLLKHISCLRD